MTRLPSNPTEQDLSLFYEELKEGINNLRKALDVSHYGMDDVKSRILQYYVRDSLARAYTGKGIGKPILLVSSPGQGKTSIGSAIAEGLKRPFKKIALGAMSRIEELVGFSSMYKDSDTGKVMKAMGRGVLNPVILLDEIDKMEKGIKGNPIDALLSYIDPAQNEGVEDEFSQCKYPFNEILFIATANSIDNIPQPVLDRFEVIHLPPYTKEEKAAIIKKHALPNLLKEWSVGTRVAVPDLNEVVNAILENVREHGVRQSIARLSKTIGRALVDSYLTGAGITLTGTTTRRLLRTAKAEGIKSPPDAEGKITGLAFSNDTNEGVLLPIQAVLHKMDGTDRFKFEGFGLMGDTMRASLGRAVENALKRAREMNDQRGDLSGQVLSVVLGRQGIETDGDSAGAAFYFASLSALTGIPVRQNVAITGAISSGPTAMRVGAIEGKISAAINGGKTTIFLPAEVRETVGNIVRSNGTSLGLVEDVTGDSPSQVLRIPHLLWQEGYESEVEAKTALTHQIESAGLKLNFESGAAVIKGNPDQMNEFSLTTNDSFARPHLCFFHKCPRLKIGS
ncbi:MAG: AAA family ATPase [Elusimicrobia bacterium]|nr:AAA family ATPase [Elusimicrobiota bacterium]